MKKSYYDRIIFDQTLNWALYIQREEGNNNTWKINLINPSRKYSRDISRSWMWAT